MNAIKHLYVPAPDQLLYHYTSFETANLILNSNSFRLSEYTMLNDESEFKYAKSVFIDEMKKRRVYVDAGIRALLAMTFPAFTKKTVMLVGSMTENRDDVSMWDRYAEHGSGCVLGLEATWLLNFAGVALRKIVYEEDYLRNFTNATLRMLNENFETSKIDPNETVRLVGLLIADLFSFKDPRFNSEQEIRISRLVLADEATSTGLMDSSGHTSVGAILEPLQIGQRIGQYGTTRFLDLPLGTSNANSAIKSIGLGPKCSLGKNAIYDLLGRTANGVQIWKSDLPLR